MLQSALPFNQYGPTAYIKPDAINLNEDIPSLEHITQPIDYIDTFPIIDGLPFWERLDCEPFDYYDLFKDYRNDDQHSLKRIARKYELPNSFVHALSKIYHWQIRAAQYDRYQANEFEKARNKAIVAMEGRHKKAAEELFEIVLTEIKKWKKENLLTTASLKELKDLLETAIKFERLSLGISPDKPITEEDVKPIRNIININNTKNTQNQNTINLEKPQPEEVSRLQQVLDVLVLNNALPQKQVDIDNNETLEAEILDEKEDNNA